MPRTGTKLFTASGNNSYIAIFTSRTS